MPRGYLNVCGGQLNGGNFFLLRGEREEDRDGERRFMLEFYVPRVGRRGGMSYN